MDNELSLEFKIEDLVERIEFEGTLKLNDVTHQNNIKIQLQTIKLMAKVIKELKEYEWMYKDLCK